MTNVISFINAKGGVGKTTLSVNVAGGLAERGHRVLLVDLDPQGSSTTYLKPDTPTPDVGDLLLERASFREVVRGVHGLDMLPMDAFRHAETLENIVAMQVSSEMCLVTALEDQLDNYDYIIIDCPPSIGKLTGNALYMSDLFIVPVLTEPLSVEGIALLHRFVDKIRRVNRGLRFGGYLLNKYNENKPNRTYKILAAALKDLGEDFPCLETYVREDKVTYDVILHNAGHVFCHELKAAAGMGRTNCVEDFENLCTEREKLVHERA
jgi:chromosome partitioning protein